MTKRSKTKRSKTKRSKTKQAINIFDRGLKVMAGNHADTFLKLTFPDVDAELLGTVQNVEISLPVRPVDFVHKVVYQGQERLFHLEFQLEHRSEIPQRTFITSAELTDQFGQEVLSVVMYLKPRQSPLPNSYPVKLGGVVINEFKYKILKVWEYVEQIKDGTFRELAPLLPLLVKDPDEKLLAKERALILEEEDQKKRAALLATAVTIAARYFDKAFLWRFFKEEIEQMKNVSFIEDWIAEGVERGELKGLEKGLEQGLEKGLEKGLARGLEKGRLTATRENLIEALLIRFDPSARLLRPLEKQLEKLDDLPALQALYRKALAIKTFDAFATWMADFLDKEAVRTKEDGQTKSFEAQPLA